MEENIQALANVGREVIRRDMEAVIKTVNTNTISDFITIQQGLESDKGYSKIQRDFIKRRCKEYAEIRRKTREIYGFETRDFDIRWGQAVRMLNLLQANYQSKLEKLQGVAA